MPDLNTYFVPAAPELEPAVASPHGRRRLARGTGPTAHEFPDDTVAPLRLCLLGGFRVERRDQALPDSIWRRRTAKALTKLLATNPRHQLHREQILDILWSDVGAASARNSFAKALHAARRALEPELPARAASAYLHLRDEMVVLDMRHVVVDADEFELLAHQALELRRVPAYEAALAVYAGELLPEDRYADWSEDRRSALRDLYVRVLVELADALEERGARNQAAESLRSALRSDATREDVHRRLMRLYAELGAPDKALRQFHICSQTLQRELYAAPGRETEELYHDLLASRVSGIPGAPQTIGEVIESRPLRGVPGRPSTPFVGRKRILQLLHDQLSRAERGRGLVILISGDAGVGKTRLVARFLEEARRRGAASLEAASDSEHRRHHRLTDDPALVHFAPSLASDVRPTAAPSLNGNGEPASLATVVQLLTNLDGTRPVVITLGDVVDLASSGSEMLEMLGELSAHRRWLVIGTAPDGEIDDTGQVQQRLQALAEQGICLHFDLTPLERSECDELVRALLPGGEVDAELLDHIYSQAVGNPLLAEELVRELLAATRVSLNNHSWCVSAVRNGREPSDPE
jgi:DNA-binding SARP family transcriptional activator